MAACTASRFLGKKLSPRSQLQLWFLGVVLLAGGLRPVKASFWDLLTRNMHPPPPPPPPPPTLNESNATAPAAEGGSLAEMIDRVLEKEFPDKDPSDGAEAGSTFNSTVEDQKAVLETVARVTHDKPPKNDSDGEGGGKPKSFQLQDLIQKDESGSGDVPILIDSEDNVFVISNPRKGYMVLQQDLRFMSDLVVVIVSSAVGGVVFAMLNQPVITGYLLAGSAVGPGGLGLVSELVQVESLAQFGVIFVLFGLGLEFSAAKLRAVRGVAIVGGLLQIVLFMFFCAITALLCGAKLSEGVFVGAFLSISSTAVVLRCLMERNAQGSIHGQISVGTLILQDCAVGMLFALLPVLGGSGDFAQGFFSILKVLLLLLVFVGVSVYAARTVVAFGLSHLANITTQTHELYQLTAVAFCLLMAWGSDLMGLSMELGAFLAGVMISATDQAEHTLNQVEPIRNMFAALFLTSIGMIMNPSFLWSHCDILIGSVILVIIVKTVLVTAVVRSFGHSIHTALTVGMSLAQIGEFAFVLLSRASNLQLVPRKLYRLLLGTTALSLISTPLLFFLIPHVIRIGTNLRWLRPDIETEMLPLKGEKSEKTDASAARYKGNGDKGDKTEAKDPRYKGSNLKG